MTTVMSKTALKARALELFRDIQATGQPLILTEHGRPVLQIRPWQGETRTPLDVLKGSVQRYDRPTEPVAEEDWEVA